MSEHNSPVYIRIYTLMKLEEKRGQERDLRMKVEPYSTKRCYYNRLQAQLQLQILRSKYAQKSKNTRIVLNKKKSK